GDYGFDLNKNRMIKTYSSSYDEDIFNNFWRYKSEINNILELDSSFILLSRGSDYSQVFNLSTLINKFVNDTWHSIVFDKMIKNENVPYTSKSFYTNFASTNNRNSMFYIVLYGGSGRTQKTILKKNTLAWYCDTCSIGQYLDTLIEFSSDEYIQIFFANHNLKNKKWMIGRTQSEYH